MKTTRMLILTSLLIAIPLIAQQRGGPGNRGGTPVLGTPLTIHGSVVAFTSAAGAGIPSLVVNDGSSNKTFVLGPSWYLQQANFAASPGDAVTVVALACSNCPAGSAVVSVADHTNGAQITLRDDAGLPLWAGRSNGSPRGAMSPGYGSCRNGSGIDISRAETFDATVVSFAGGPGQGMPLLTVSTAAGDRVVLVGPYAVLLDAGYAFVPGAKLVVKAAPALNGIAAEWVAISIRDVATGLEIEFRDANGIPYGGMRGRP